MNKTWALVRGEDLVQEVEALLSHLVKAVDMTVLEGGTEAEQFIETVQMDVQGLADELRETLTVNAGLLDLAMFIDYDAPMPILTNMPAEEMLEDEGAA